MSPREIPVVAALIVFLLLPLLLGQTENEFFRVEDLEPGMRGLGKTCFRKSDGETLRDVYPLDIPPIVPPGPLHVLVADGATLMTFDNAESGDEVLIPRGLSHLIQLINNIRKNDRLYVRLFRREPGAVIRGEGLPGLPPSVLSILESERRSGALSPLAISSILEYELLPVLPPCPTGSTV